MKNLLGALLVAVLVQVFPAKAEFVDGNRLKQGADAALRMDENRYYEGSDPVLGAGFAYYVEGVVDANDSPSDGFCLPRRVVVS